MSTEHSQLPKPQTTGLAVRISFIFYLSKVALAAERASQTLWYKLGLQKADRQPHCDQELCQKQETLVSSL